MNATSINTNLEPRWQTYLKAMSFALPAVVTWGFVCLFIFPAIKDFCAGAHLELSKVGWLWNFPIFLLGFGRSICIVLFLILVLQELFVRGWARQRRVMVSILVCVVNVAVFVGLTTLLISVLFAARELLHAK